jgi:acetylornithine deacetylase/succinyl-diaminopimelate desuccinylase-like protein
MLTNLEKKVLAAVKKEEVVPFLQGMIRIPSMSANEQKVAEYIADNMRGWGFQEVFLQGIESHPGRANLVAWLRGKKRKPTLMTTAHLDTTTIDTADRGKWIVDPLSAEVREGCIYGIGSVDDKGGCAVVVMAAKAIMDAGVELAGDLLIGLVADEEGQMIGIKQFIKSNVHKSVDACLSGDPFGMPLIMESWPGRTFGVVTFEGRNAHAGASPWSGIGLNAIHKAGKFLAVLDNSAPEHSVHPVYGKSFWQALKVEGGWPGTLSAQKPDWCKILLDIRLVPGHDPEEAWADLRRLIEGLQSQDSDIKATIEVWDRRPGYTLPRDNALMKATAGAYEELVGRPIQYGGWPVSKVAAIGTTDTHYLAYEGIPCVNAAGPTPEGGIAHAANENIPIDILEENVKAVALTILRYFDL